MADLTALYDACVLYPAPLVIRPADAPGVDGTVPGLWTDAIHEEWIPSVLADRPALTRGQLERTRDLMNAHVEGCLVTGYEDLIPALELPDPGRPARPGGCDPVFSAPVGRDR